MMKIVALLLVILVAVNGQDCFKHFTRAEAGTSGGNTFTGITNGTGTEDYNNPLWYSVADAQTGLSVPAKGRLSAKLPTTTFIGEVTFDFFKKRPFWFFFSRTTQLKITFTKSTATGVITGGTGCYKGISGGTATRVQVGTTLPKVFEWTFCPTTAAKCTPK
jgi:hypothetical protein